MKKNRVVLSIVLIVMFLGIQTPQFAQDTTPRPANADQTRHQLAIALLRTIGTVEVTYHAKNGSFAIWETLVSSLPQYFDKFLKVNNVRFSDPPEILPGWNLRLNVHSDGQGYDILLRDVTDEKCGYAVLTDESGIIRQSKATYCPF